MNQVKNLNFREKKGDTEVSLDSAGNLKIETVNADGTGKEVVIRYPDGEIVGHTEAVHLDHVSGHHAASDPAASELDGVAEKSISDAADRLYSSKTFIAS